MRIRLVSIALLVLALPVRAQRADAVHSEIDRESNAIAAKLTAWRHDIHSHPELSFQETRTAKLVASDGRARDNFGVSVTIDGKTAFIGAPGATVHGHVSQGSVYRFEEQGTQWTQAQHLVIHDGVPISWFGSSVNYQSPTLLVGSYAINAYRGAAYVFGRPNSAAPFALQRKLVASDAQPGDVFGYFSALDGNTALVTAWGADIGTKLSQGAAYFYRLGPVDS